MSSLERQPESALERRIAVTDNATPALGVGRIRMGRDMRLNFRFNRLAQQLPGASPQDIRQRIIGKWPWLAKCITNFLFHGVSHSSQNRRLDHRQDTPPLHHAIAKTQLSLPKLMAAQERA